MDITAEYNKSQTPEAVQRLHSFAAKVAEALESASIPSIQVMALSQLASGNSKGWSGFFAKKSVTSEQQRQLLVDGWLVAELDRKSLVWKADDNPGGAGRFENESTEFYLSRTGSFMIVDIHRVRDHRSDYQRKPYDNTSRSCRNADEFTIGLLDYRWKLQDARNRQAHEDRTWYQSGLVHHSFGVGLSSSLRRLADKHTVLPRKR